MSDGIGYRHSGATYHLVHNVEPVLRAFAGHAHRRAILVVLAIGSPVPGEDAPSNGVRYDGKTRMVFPHREALHAWLLPFRNTDGTNSEV